MAKKAPVKRAPAKRVPAKKAATSTADATPAADATATAPAQLTSAPTPESAEQPSPTRKVAAANGGDKSSVRVPIDRDANPGADTDPGADETPATDGNPASDEPPAFTALAEEDYISLTTFRRAGSAVPTPVWAAPDEDKLLVWTGAKSGKVKRLHHTAKVTVAPCDKQGRLLGEPVPATARVLPLAEMPRVKAAMRAKYGWQFSVAAFGTSVGRFLRIKPHGQIGVEITLD